MNKIKVQQCYPVVTNYWDPLETIEEEDDTEEEIINNTIENTPKSADNIRQQMDQKIRKETK